MINLINMNKETARQNYANGKASFTRFAQNKIDKHNNENIMCKLLMHETRRNVI